MTKILVADDDLEIQELLTYTLQNEGYQVSVASDGEETLRKISSDRPDLLVLDVLMPKISGYEVLEKLRASPTTSLLPVIMVTSLTPVKDRITGIKLGADEYICKPFNPYELVARIEGLLRRVRTEISANPLTGLPGKVSFESKLKELISENQDFIVIYLDIDNFKSINDKFGTDRGDSIIKNFATKLCSIIAKWQDKIGFIGHLSGEDFALIISAWHDIDVVAKELIEEFNNVILPEYDEISRVRGYFWWKTSDGTEKKVPIVTLSIGVIKVTSGEYLHPFQIVEQVKEMWRIAKSKEGNSYVFLPGKNQS